MGSFLPHHREHDVGRGYGIATQPKSRLRAPSALGKASMSRGSGVWARVSDGWRSGRGDGYIYSVPYTLAVTEVPRLSKLTGTRFFSYSIRPSKEQT